MRKFHVAGVAVAAMSLALTAGAFASWPAGSAGGGADPGSSVQPGHPIVLSRGNLSPAIRSARNTSRIDSTNWAGYAAARPGTVFRYVRATFFVPYVDCATTPNAFSSHWVGLDGLDSRTAEQLGVEAGCAGAIPEYYAWYEMYPGNESSAFFVKPGNSIAASVYYNRRDKTFALTLDDTTTGRHFSRILKCTASSCPRSSAEVISESPSGSRGKPLPLADYRASGFSDIAVADSPGHRGRLNSRWWSTYQIIQVGGSSTRVAGQPTSLFQGRAFGNYWFRES